MDCTKRKKADYTILYKKAKVETDVEKISQIFLQYNEFSEIFELNIQKENTAQDQMKDFLNKKGFTYEDLEDIILAYSGTIQDIYIELGVKVGAKLEMENLCDPH